MKGLLHSIRITDDIVFNLFSDTQGNGAVGLSLRNTGEVPLIIEDGANEEIAPGQYFFCRKRNGYCKHCLSYHIQKRSGQAPRGYNALYSATTPLEKKYVSENSAVFK